MKITRSIQVWHANAAETAIPEREFAAFKIRGKAAEKRDCLMITNDWSGAMKVGGKQIQCMPLILFLLDLP